MKIDTAEEDFDMSDNKGELAVARETIQKLEKLLARVAEFVKLQMSNGEQN